MAPQSSAARSTQPAHQQAAADFARTQIDSIYDTDPNASMDAPQPELSTALGVEREPATGQPVAQAAPVASEAQARPQVILDKKKQFSPEITSPRESSTDQQPSPYMRTHDETKLHTNAINWDEYHSAWQRYYQEYFQRYYAGHAMGSQPSTPAESSVDDTPQEITPEQAMDDLRSQLRAKIRERSKKVRKSRHFMPIMAGVAVMVVFLFLQYNRVIFAYANAYVSPGAINPDNIIVDPDASLQVSSDPRLIIPKINVDVPVIYDNTMGSDQTETYNKQMAAMAKGVAWFGIAGADSHPGQKGNTVLSGHSSNDWFDLGDLKFVFANLDRMKKDDTIYVNYRGTRYTYQVTDRKIVLPTQLSALQTGSDKAMLTLITCTPLGTSEKRLLVFAEQVSPDPDAATSAPSVNPASKSTEIPGVRSKFLGGLFN
jgi:sortase A